MDRRENYKNRIELPQGTLDMSILQSLSWGPAHGYGIGRWNQLSAAIASLMNPGEGEGQA